MQVTSGLRNHASTVLAAPASDRPLNLGEWCVRTGAATADQVRECLELQKSCHEKGASAPRLGELMVARGYLSPGQVADALASQGREIRSCAGCGVRVNVVLRPDAIGYECARCRGTLHEPSDPARLSVADESVVVRSLDPLPPEVGEAARDPRNLLGKYVLLGELGRGGIGQVYLAWDTFLRQRVALKRMRPDMPSEVGGDEPEKAETLAREARTAIRLRHPAIVSVFDVGLLGGEPYISMEYVEGASLDDELRRARSEGRLSPFHDDPARALRLLAEVARALHYAHTSPAGVVHCDLKPGNVMVDPQGRPHLLDFGLARRLGPSRVRERRVSGTPNYMSPEQAEGRTWEIDARTDVYGLGALLYELLGGRPPFTGDPLEILQRVTSEAPIRPSLLAARAGAGGLRVRPIPRFVEELCLRCLEKNPGRRPQTMLEVADVLERAAGAEAAAARTPTLAPRRGRPRLLPAAAASLLFATALALGAAIPRGTATAPPSPADPAAAELGAFRPEAVLRRSADPGLREEAARVESIRARILDRMSGTGLAFEELRLRERTLRDARITGGDSRSLSVRASGVELRVAWSDLEPSQLLSIARESGMEGDADGLLALAIFSLRSGRRMDAKEYFEALRRGPHAPLAERYLASR